MASRLIVVTLLFSLSNCVFAFEFNQARIDLLVGSAWIKNKEKNHSVHTGQIISVMDEIVIDDNSEIYITYWHPQTKRQILTGLKKNKVNNTIWDTIKPANFEKSASSYFSTNTVVGGGSRDDGETKCLLPETLKLPTGVGKISLTAANCAIAEQIGMTAKLVYLKKAESIDGLAINTDTIAPGIYAIEFRFDKKVIHTSKLEITPLDEIKEAIQKVASNQQLASEYDFEEIQIIASYINGYTLLADKLVHRRINSSNNIESDADQDSAWPAIIKDFISNSFVPIALPQK
ncbi:hypothetical protein MN202_14430 [Rheinheimera muenzenbergensis]|uniref:Uncharacterized protein n=1 Tax=Rheinheimera muenzenbergensis TaxID=1193628 RepID=A0ABU8C8Z1_9GAMM